MKRALVALAFVSVVCTSFAQNSFTIRRPLENATVRENVSIRIPLKAVPDGAFVGIWINGKFQEAVAPVNGVNVEGSDFVYKLDSKARKIPDGRMTVEAVLYYPDARFTRPVDRTSVTLRLDNSASIKIPEGGLKLRYAWRNNSEFIYRVNLKTAISNISEAQQQLGRGGSQLSFDGESLRLRFAVINRQPNGSAVVLSQPLTEKGKDYAILTTTGATEAKKYFANEMAPVYNLYSSTGFEQWGAFPIFVPGEGAYSTGATTDLFPIIPLPVLPQFGVRPGQPAFPGSFAESQVDLTDRINLDKFYQYLPAQSTLESIEFERGRPCVKIRNVYAVGARDTGIQEYEELYWFALDLGMPIKVERNSSTIQRVRNSGGPGAGGGGGTGGSGGGGGSDFSRVTPAKSTGPTIDRDLREFGPLRSMPRAMQNRDGREGDDGGDARGARVGGGNTGGPGAGAGQGGRRGGGVRIVRITNTIVMELE